MTYSGRGRPPGALARLQAAAEQLAEQVADQIRDCGRIRGDAERLADGAGGHWPEALRPVTAAEAAAAAVSCPACSGVMTDVIGLFLGEVDELLRRRVQAFRRAGTRLIASADAARRQARKKAAEADASRPPIGYVVRDGGGLAVGYGESLGAASADARARGHDGPGSPVPASPLQYEAAIAALEG